MNHPAKLIILFYEDWSPYFLEKVFARYELKILLESSENKLSITENAISVMLQNKHFVNMTRDDKD